MAALLIRRRVPDYATWKQVFGEQGLTRWSNGCRGGQVFRNADDLGEMLILLEWDDLLRARLFSQSDEWQESLKREGVIDDPEIWFLDLTDEVAS